MKAATSIPLGLILACTLSSCSVQGSVGREDLLSRPSTAGRFDHFKKPPGQPVMSYTTVDGSVHAFEGSAWIEGDSLVFVRGEREFSQSMRPRERRRVALADLASVQAVDQETGATLVVVVLVIGALVGIAYLYTMAAWGWLSAF